MEASSNSTTGQPHEVFDHTGLGEDSAIRILAGDGQNAAARLTYSISRVKKGFTLGLLSSAKGVTGRLKVDTSDMTGRTVEVRTNGVLMGSFIAGGLYTYDALGDGQTITLTVPGFISIERFGPGLLLRWSAGRLLESSNVTGEWRTNAAAVSPHLTMPTNTQSFFRLTSD